MKPCAVFLPLAASEFEERRAELSLGLGTKKEGRGEVKGGKEEGGERDAPSSDGTGGEQVIANPSGGRKEEEVGQEASPESGKDENKASGEDPRSLFCFEAEKFTADF